MSEANTHMALQDAFENYEDENEKFKAGNNAAGTRARKALAEVMKLAKERRLEIQAKKNAEAELKKV